LRLNNLLTVFALVSFLSLMGQPPKDESTYLFPIRPNEQNFLSGTMGEMRSTHFHGGLDIKTGGRIGLPVHATSDGYIVRMNTYTGGYGHALYLQHDDGNVSVYGHLDRFNDELEAYMHEKHYQYEKYDIRVFPKKDQFKYKRGDIIGFSGNTGSSSGPHLHFEIRNSEQRFLNPLDFGFTEIQDNLPPLIKKIAFVSKHPSARINGAFGRFEFDVLKVNGVYTLRKPIELSGKIGVEIYHYDHLNGTYHRNGIPEITYTVDGDTLFRQVKNSMSFDLNRHILSHMNYANYARTRRKFNKLYIDDGNEQDFYLSGNGIFEFDKKSSYELKIILRDNFDNITLLSHIINQRKIVYPEVPKFRYFSIQDNVLQYKSDDSVSMVYYAHRRVKQQPYFKRSGRYFYLWELDKGLPDSIVSGTYIHKPNFYMSIPSGISYSFYNSDFELESYPKSLFDTLHVRFHNSYDSLTDLELFSFHNYLDPIANNLKITLKPRKFYGEKAAVYSKSGDKLTFIGGKQHNDGTFVFFTRNLSNFTISYDSIPPTITPVTWSKPSMKFKIIDRESGIKSYHATLNGEFLLLIYDSKKDLITTRPKHPNIPMSGEFVLKIEDNKGNISELKRIL
jgi:cupin superfamily acireductone dioxygenase involved in methionine salvage